MRDEILLIADSADALVLGIVTIERVAARFGMFAAGLTHWFVQSRVSIAAFADVLGCALTFTPQSASHDWRTEQSVHLLEKPFPYPASRYNIGWRTLGSGTAVPQLLEKRYLN